MFYKQVFTARPLLWGLSYGGERGARAVLEVFRKEIDVAFALTGKIKTLLFEISILLQ